MWYRGKQDADLVRRTLHGDSGAFGILVHRYLPAVRAQALARLHTRVDADDVAQDAILRAYEKLDTLREPQKFGAWLLGIGRHCASRVRERRMREATYADQTASEECVEPPIERRELLEQLRLESIGSTTLPAKPCCSTTSPAAHPVKSPLRSIPRPPPFANASSAPVPP